MIDPSFSERSDNPTPNGGAYSIAYFSRDGEPCRKEDATEYMVVEFDHQDNGIFRTYLTNQS